MQRLGDDGSLLGEPTLVFDSSGQGGSVVADRAEHVWNGIGYGVALSVCETDEGPCELQFVSLDADGEQLSVALLSADVETPALAWNESEYAVAWQGQGIAPTEFVRVSAMGSQLGQPQVVSGATMWHAGPTLSWTGSEYGVFATPDRDIAEPSIWLVRIGCNCFDDDEDGLSVCNGDCDDSNPATKPGAVEINDGADNQCPGDIGYGLADEVAPGGFNDATEFSWPPQPGAATYRVVRSSEPLFESDCSVVEVSVSAFVDEVVPAPGVTFHYLTQSFTPIPGDWGASTLGGPRVVSCVAD